MEHPFGGVHPYNGKTNDGWALTAWREKILDDMECQRIIEDLVIEPKLRANMFLYDSHCNIASCHILSRAVIR